MIRGRVKGRVSVRDRVRVRAEYNYIDRGVHTVSIKSVLVSKTDLIQFISLPLLCVTYGTTAPRLRNDFNTISNDLE